MRARLPPLLLAAVATLGTGCGPGGGEPFVVPPDAAAAEWIDYGGDRGGLRYSPLADVTPANVDRLELAWEHHTGDVSTGDGEVRATTAYEVTPILVDGTLYFCSPMNRVFALDPETGMERWVHDPRIDVGIGYANQLICRGVSFWRDTGPDPDQACARRIFTATNDARLIALDASTG